MYGVPNRICILNMISIPVRVLSVNFIITKERREAYVEILEETGKTHDKDR